MKFFMLAILVCICGCQSIVEEHRKQMAVLCTYDGGYSKGVEHADSQEGSSASTTLTNCDSTSIPEALRGYNDGYASRNVQQDNSFTGLLGQVIKSKEKSQYVCEVEVFTDKFSEKGRSKAEALHNTKVKCSASRQDGDFFCKKTSEYVCKKLF